MLLYTQHENVFFFLNSVPPRHILITSSWDGGRIVAGTIGPYPEGADVTLSCQVTGGKYPIDIFL